uniref:Uncharacterized protein n=1 Tax=Rhizophora mucronata TaxID=61149 RepID=A0A2P2Q1R9_RHIMU
MREISNSGQDLYIRMAASYIGTFIYKYPDALGFPEF